MSGRSSSFPRRLCTPLSLPLSHACDSQRCRDPPTTRSVTCPPRIGKPVHISLDAFVNRRPRWITLGMPIRFFLSRWMVRHVWLEELVWLYSGDTFIRREGYALKIINNYVGIVAWNVQDLLRQFPDIKTQNKNKLFQELDIDLNIVINNLKWKGSDESSFKSIEKEISFFPIIFIFYEKNDFLTLPVHINIFFSDVYHLHIIIIIIRLLLSVFYPRIRDSASTVEIKNA